MGKPKEMDDEVPQRFRILGRGSGVCVDCDEPAAIEVDYGGHELNLKMCWGCYHTDKPPDWPEIDDLRREAGWQV